nr:hypothetical protein [Spirosoma sp. KNUC1025]
MFLEAGHPFSQFAPTGDEGIFYVNVNNEVNSSLYYPIQDNADE